MQREVAKMEGRGKIRGEGATGQMMTEGALGVLVILIYSTPYTLKSFAALPK